MIEEEEQDLTMSQNVSAYSAIIQNQMEWDDGAVLCHEKKKKKE